MLIRKAKIAICTLAAMSFSYTVTAAVPHVFQSNSPAKATEVNQNFAYLDERADQIEGRVLVLEQQKEGQGSTSASLVIDGVSNLRTATIEQYYAALSTKPMVNAIEKSVDCTDDKYALRETYLRYAFAMKVELSVTGVCYGSLTSVADSYIQIHNQVLSITGASEDAAIVADPTTKMVNLLGGFGGGLYLLNIDISLGTSDFAILLSRNSQNSIENVVIKGVDGSDNWGIWAQGGSQFYLNNAVIDSPNGIGLASGASMRTLGGTVTIQSDALKYALVSRGATARLKGTIEVKGKRDESLDFWDPIFLLTAGSNFYNDFDGNAKLDIQVNGLLNATDDANLSLEMLSIVDGVIGLNHAKLQTNEINHLAGGMYVVNLADFRASSGVMGNDNDYWSTIANSSWVDIQNVSGSSVGIALNGNSTFATTKSNWKSLYANMGTTVFIDSAVFSSTVELQNQSVANIVSEQSTTTMSALWINTASTVNANNIEVSGNVDMTKNSTLNLANSTISELNLSNSSATVNTVTLTKIIGEGSTIDVDASTVPEAAVSRGSNLKMNNVSDGGKITADFNSNLSFNNSKVENISARFNSSVQLGDSTVTGASSVFDWLSASIYIDRNSTLGFWGTSGLEDGALPIRIEALSFAEFDFGTDQGLDGITIEQCNGSVVFVPESANAILNTNC